MPASCAIRGNVLKTFPRTACGELKAGAIVAVFAAQTTVLQRLPGGTAGEKSGDANQVLCLLGGEILAVDDENNFSDCLTNSKEIVHNLTSA
ncbi:hypothetical protein, partial [Roseateles chitosanitabidus]|uniref:hypothetical protein n=1 Tax=Roseateles chitosanitabidus TaxID=65048 RepID=UPI001C3F5BE2